MLVDSIGPQCDDRVSESRRVQSIIDTKALERRPRRGREGRRKGEMATVTRRKIREERCLGKGERWLGRREGKRWKRYGESCSRYWKREGSCEVQGEGNEEVIWKVK